MISLNKQQVSIRQFITRTFLEKGYEPTAKEIGEFAGVQIEETKKILKELVRIKLLSCIHIRLRFGLLTHSVLHLTLSGFKL